MLGVRRPDLHEFAGVALDGAIYNVFTIAGDAITRVEDHASRDQALAAAGVSEIP